MKANYLTKKKNSSTSMLEMSEFDYDDEGFDHAIKQYDINNNDDDGINFNVRQEKYTTGQGSGRVRRLLNIAKKTAKKNIMYAVGIAVMIIIFILMFASGRGHKQEELLSDEIYNSQASNNSALHTDGTHTPPSNVSPTPLPIPIDNKDDSQLNSPADVLCHWQSFTLPEKFVPKSYNITLQINNEEDPFDVAGFVVIKVAISRLKSGVNSTRCIVINIDSPIIPSAITSINALAVHDASDNLSIDNIVMSTVGQIRTFDTERGQAIIEFDSLLPLGDIILQISFEYYMQADEETGLFLSKYANTCVEYESRYEFLATSRFDSLNARRAFPCFDDYNLRANYNIKIITRKGNQAISNVKSSRKLEDVIDVREWHDLNPLIDSSRKHGLNLYEFEILNSPLYMLAIVVGRLAQVSAEDSGVIPSTEGDINIRMFATECHKNDLMFAYNAATSVLTAFTIVLGQFQRKTIDVVGLPDLYNNVESQGIIRLGASDLLVSMDNIKRPDQFTDSSLKQKANVAKGIAKKMTSQWFSNTNENLDLLLREGFSNYMQYVGMDFIKLRSNFNLASKDKKSMNKFFFHEQKQALDVDALRSSRALETEEKLYKSQMGIERLSNTLSSKKAASLLRMVRSLMSHSMEELQAGDLQLLSNSDVFDDDPFLMSFREYVEHGDEDFWTVVESRLHNSTEYQAQSSKFPIVESMNMFRYSRGFPMVHLLKDSEQIEMDNPERFYLTQQPFGNKFLPDNFTHDCDALPQKNSTVDYEAQCWNLNIPYKSSTEREGSWIILSHHGTQHEEKPFIEIDISEGTKDNSNWIFLNVNRLGYYRINYDYDMYKNLMQAIQSRTDFYLFSESDVAGLIDDKFSISLAGGDGSLGNSEKPAIVQTLEMIQAVKNRATSTRLNIGVEYSPWKVILSITNWMHFALETSGKIQSCKNTENISMHFVDYILDDLLELHVPLKLGGDGTAIVYRRLRLPLTVYLLRSELYITKIMKGSPVTFDFDACELAHYAATGDFLAMSPEDREIALALAVKLSKGSEEERTESCPEYPDFPSPEELFNRFVSYLSKFEGNSIERKRILSALATLPNVAHTLQVLLSSLQSIEMYYVMIRIANVNKESLDTLWTFILSNNEDVYLSLDPNLYGNMIVELSKLSIKSERADDFLTAYRSKLEPNHWKFNETLEVMERNEEWANNNKQFLCDFISNL